MKNNSSKYFCQGADHWMFVSWVGDISDCCQHHLRSFWTQIEQFSFGGELVSHWSLWGSFFSRIVDDLRNLKKCNILVKLLCFFNNYTHTKHLTSVMNTLLTTTDCLYGHHGQSESVWLWHKLEQCAREAAHDKRNEITQPPCQFHPSPKSPKLREVRNGDCHEIWRMQIHAYAGTNLGNSHTHPSHISQ